MNDPRSAGRPGRTGTRTRPEPRETRQQPMDPETRRRIEARRRKRRRAQQIRRFKMMVTAALILVILISLGVGYLIGYAAGKKSAEATLPPAASDLQNSPELPAQPGASEPAAAPEQTGDVTGPTILGVNAIAVFQGSTVAYRSGILVSDDTDPNPKLTVDSFLVDLTTPGTYPVYYTATDAAGNTTTVETTITVNEAPDSYVEEALINEKADELLAKIITENMTPREQVNAVYDWIEGHCYYIAKFDKSDYMQAAYLMLTNNRGDCYGFYAVSRLLFDRLGLPNLTVTRMPNEVRTTNHWWNMVSLDGGESWYHFDATPHLTEGARTCLVTDAYLETFNLENPNYYYFDHTAVPQTPAE